MTKFIARFKRTEFYDVELDAETEEEAQAEYDHLDDEDIYREENLGDVWCDGLGFSAQEEPILTRPGESLIDTVQDARNTKEE